MTAAAQAAPVVTLPAIGQPYGGGFFSGITRDPDTGKRYLNITAGAEHELIGAWGKYGEKIEGADSFTNGRANTEAMAAAGSELAQKALALRIGGYDDWAIPARDQQELQYRHFKPTTEANWQYGRSGDNPNSEPVGLLHTEDSPTQTTLEAFQVGGAEAFKPTWYWSSSQRSANDAFVMHFDGGGQYSFGKVIELRVRPVRSQLID
ncbi:DUF1566 domain-containing protein [Pseudomonas vancouverensis]|uniref:DUF1566 domain-containing protein n=1 Tax=Pseudomonas vancouverensis TaxID=95300 RepID=A0A1H2MU73_PSEVA|nr:DUF1566 domain-containing protein [Pseudomonas vancouverensis]KAB0489730.1 DUF1566 domain-containing protein [Pseudomonas vancouverensis]TDB67226.1 DUF1566 domain-containing protein [Pseudomonas vancouverensis]SDU96632.1 hypothetical protein SAMN05216558_1264 [Pseudomonas vancouverensis]